MTIPPVLAGDLGGTNFRGALVNRSGRILGIRSIPLPRPATPKAVLGAMISVFRPLARSAPLPPRILSLSFKGLVDAERGISQRINNFENWRNVPVAARLKASLRLPVLIENDARCAALGEGWLGRARGCPDFVLVIVGTGIGTGVVREGRLWRGPRGHAGEYGHTLIDSSDRELRCGCGEYGHWEGLAAGPSLGERAKRLLRSGRARDLARRLKSRPGPVDGKFVSAALAAGAPTARRIVREAGSRLGLGLYNLVRAEDAPLIVIAGGAAALGEALLRPARNECAKRLARFNLPCPKIAATSLGDHAGLLGAAALAFSADKRRPAPTGRGRGPSSP